MPSRKKAKGKARKAAKDEKAEEEESRAVEVAAGQRQVQDESLEAQLQRLGINAKLCMHGCPRHSLSPDEEKICQEFIDAFTAAFLSQNDVGGSLTTAYNATKDEYPDVYSSKLDTVNSILLANGTQLILGRGNHNKAKLYASLASYFEDVAAGLRGSEAVVSLVKPAELFVADDHTLVSFYRKRIPCSCLDEKYKEVKSVKKMGLCHNLNCNLPLRKVERRKMLCCTRCGEANYCSIECQRADWKEHRVQCEAVVKTKAVFDSNQSKLLSVEKWSRYIDRFLLQWLLIATWAIVLGVEFPDTVVCCVSCLPL